MVTKVCIKCHVEKELDEFYNCNDGSKDGKRNACIECRKNYSSMIRKRNRENNKKIDLSGTKKMYILFSITT